MIVVLVLTIIDVILVSYMAFRRPENRTHKYVMVDKETVLFSEKDLEGIPDSETDNEEKESVPHLGEDLVRRPDRVAREEHEEHEKEMAPLLERS
jgi:hypothetical protein